MTKSEIQKILTDKPHLLEFMKEMVNASKEEILFAVELLNQQLLKRVGGESH